MRSCSMTGFTPSRLPVRADDVPAILGHPARPFEQFAADHAAAFS